MVTCCSSTLQITDTTAPALAAVIEGLLTLLGVDKSRLVGFGSDGASVMTGKERAVGSRWHVDCLSGCTPLQICTIAKKICTFMKHHLDTLSDLDVQTLIR